MGRITEKIFSQMFSPLAGENISPANNLLSNSLSLLKIDERSVLMNDGAKNVNLSNNDGEPKETFWVKKAADGHQISENLLRENFGFEEIDIQAYKKNYGELTVFDEKQCAINQRNNQSCDSATAKEIGKWQTSADGKKVFVSLPQATVKFLRDFRQERLIERRVMEIADPEFRAQVENNLKTVATKQGESRAAAFVSLRNAIGNNSPDGKKAAEIVKLVGNLPENKENPLTQTLLAKIEIEEIFTGQNVMYDPKSVADIQRRINHAADLAGGFNEKNKIRDPKKALSREEAKVLNEEAARLAAKHGNPSDLRFRTLLARFYEVDDAERSKYEAMNSPQWMTLPRLKNPEERAFVAISPEKLALERFNRENPPQNVKKDLAEDPQKRVWKTWESNDGKGGIKGNQYKEYQVEGSLKPEGVEQVNGKVYLSKNGKILPDSTNADRSMPVTINRTNEREEINRAGTSRAFATAGAVAAMEEVNKWTPLLADIYYGTTAKRIALREKLEKAVFNANNYPIPPKPEKIQQMKRELLTYRYAGQSEFKQVQLTMKRLEDLSYAFWNR